MKKSILTLMLLVSVIFCASARDQWSRDVNTLPQAARTVLANNFKAKVSVIKIDKDFGSISEYEVVLGDGTEITFDSKGNWKDVEVSRGKQVPAKMFPAGITNYVKANHRNAKVVGIERKRGGFEVELSDGTDLKFDTQGRFQRYD